MKVIDSGYHYQLEALKGEALQELLFIKGHPNPDTNESVISHDGTISEEVLDALIDRHKVLNKKLPSREGSIILTHLQEARLWMRERQRLRREQDVEGTYNQHTS